MLQGCNDNSIAGLIRRGQLLLDNLSLAGFLMCVDCRGFAGTQIDAKDISDYMSKGGGSVLSDNLTIGRMPGRYNLLKAMLKKARVCVNSASGTLYLSVRLVQHLNHSLYGYELV